MSEALRDRFINTLLFEKVDRPWRWECMGFWNETVKRWNDEGLPKEVDTNEKAFFFNNFDFQAPFYFDFATNPGVFPLFEEKILEVKDDTIIKIDGTGAKVVVPKDGHETLPLVLEAPIKDRKGWEIIKERMDPKTPGRLDAYSWVTPLAKDHGWPLFVYFCGLFGAHRHLFGVEPLMYVYYDQPDLIHDIGKHWVYMWKHIFADIAAQHRPDFVYIWEDICGKNGPMISPKMFDEFMMPYYKELTGFLKNDLKIPVIGVDNDGDINLMIPKFLEGGVNFFFPFEVQAGMNVLKVREQYPTQFGIWGGIDKRELAKDKKAIETEVMKIVPPMLKMGGYIPGIDHLVPPDVSYENWNFFRDLVRDVVDRHYAAGR